MLRQMLTRDTYTIKRHIRAAQRGNGPPVVALIHGWPGLPRIYDVREALHPVSPSPELQAVHHLLGLPLPPAPPKRLEVQLHPQGTQPWHIAQKIYVRIEEK